MVFETILNPKKIKENPKKIFWISLISTILSSYLSIIIFPNRASMVMIFLTTMALLPFTVELLKQEEKEEEKQLRKYKKILFKNHWKVFETFLIIFLGLTTGYTTIFTINQTQTIQTLFTDQITTINTIRGSTTSTDTLIKIITNNLKVMFLSLVFSFIYGSGAIFIITWNASVISVAIGDLIRVGLSQTNNYFKVIPLSFMRYFVHGIPEMSAYFLAGIAGGIISIAMMRNKKEIIKDSARLIILSIILIIIAGLIEVYVSPIIK